MLRFLMVSANLITRRIAPRANCQYVIYSKVDFAVFRPAVASHFTKFRSKFQLHRWNESYAWTRNKKIDCKHKIYVVSYRHMLVQVWC